MWVELTEKQADRLKASMVGDMAHWDMYLDIPGRPDLEGVARQEQAAIREVLTALAGVQPMVLQSMVLLPLDEAAAIVALAEEAPSYAWEENGLAVSAIERIRAAQEVTR